MIERLEWINGPVLFLRQEVKMRRGVLVPAGPRRRLLVGSALAIRTRWENVRKLLREVRESRAAGDHP